MKKYAFVIIILLLLIFLLFLKSCTNKEEIKFTDKKFESMVKSELKLDKISESDLDGITGILIDGDDVIGFSGKGRSDKSVILFDSNEFEYIRKRYLTPGTIKTLDDLKYFKNLTSIRIYLQPEIDYNTIPNKNVIVNLGLSQNKINSLKFLEGFSSLWNLSLSSNEIVDISGIENLENLTRLSFILNKIENISLLSNLTKLNHLDLTYNKVSDLSPLSNLKLEYLSLYSNKVVDIKPLESISTLRELYLNNNQIFDVSPLASFDSFDKLNVSGNPIKNIEVLDHIKNIVK